MKKTSILRLLSLLVLAASLSGCIVIGNRGDTRDKNITVGQQLLDLQKAKDAGAISEAEYQTQKAKILGTAEKHH